MILNHVDKQKEKKNVNPQSHLHLIKKKLLEKLPDGGMGWHLSRFNSERLGRIEPSGTQRSVENSACFVVT